MTAPAIDPRPGFDAEWSRVELLARCATERRLGRSIEEPVLAQLAALGQAVTQARRADTAWQRAARYALEGMEHDVLACVLAPEIEPRIGWLYQELQLGPRQPYATRALLQELLAIPAADLRHLGDLLSEDAPLRRLALIECDDSSPFAPIRPARGVVARLLGFPVPSAPPPGTTKVSLRAGWDDLVLPADRVAMMREYVSWIEHRSTVIDQWEGRATGGPVALFCGPSGTGKTLAASVIASELGWPLYRVDLGSLVSKYIGETEKNLNLVFSDVHARQAVLQFDEADSLFGKRGEIRDARDRYANLEVSHLLARIEQHDGPCILTTNLRGNLDPAFARRFQIVIDFPRPDLAARSRLWRLHLPRKAPLEATLDLDAIAGAVHLTGGAIRNAAMHAAFLAAAGRGVIGMPELSLAIWRELGKDGRSLSPADLGPLASFVPRGALC
ncbi:MAG TPA: ATP-binding protein [Kofleriaceae bacterium]